MARLRVVILLAVLALVSANACYQAPADMAQAEMLLGVSDALNDLRTENAILQDQIDSLYAMVTRQDTLVRRMAEQMGMAIPR